MPCLRERLHHYHSNVLRNESCNDTLQLPISYKYSFMKGKPNQDLTAHVTTSWGAQQTSIFRTSWTIALLEPHFESLCKFQNPWSFSRYLFDFLNWPFKNKKKVPECMSAVKTLHPFTAEFVFQIVTFQPKKSENTLHLWCPTALGLQEWDIIAEAKKITPACHATSNSDERCAFILLMEEIRRTSAGW